MLHARTSIRQTFVDILKGKTAAKDKVYDSRLYSMNDSTLPGIIIFSSQEEIVTSTISPPRCQNRTARITVECYAKATTSVNIIVDNMTAEVESLVLNNPELKKLCKDCRLESTDINLNSDGDQPVAVASLVFTVIYQTKETSPNIII
ncbi:hypothetical protein [Candidatus Tisiphia endosymbiont of Micropterix aruncella]|uniref:hypothetical protein n=1 Tax=Candidatus Tisiphia endosymbiont of Micropterix aruncella TaxID=3066271 RepID=UPI003AA9090F